MQHAWEMRVQGVIGIIIFYISAPLFLGINDGMLPNSFGGPALNSLERSILDIVSHALQYSQHFC